MDNRSYFRFDDDNKKKQYILSTITRDINLVLPSRNTWEYTHLTLRMDREYIT